MLWFQIQPSIWSWESSQPDLRKRHNTDLRYPHVHIWHAFNAVRHASSHTEFIISVVTVALWVPSTNESFKCASVISRYNNLGSVWTQNGETVLQTSYKHRGYFCLEVHTPQIGSCASHHCCHAWILNCQIQLRCMAAMTINTSYEISEVFTRVEQQCHEQQSEIFQQCFWFFFFKWNSKDKFSLVFAL